VATESKGEGEVHATTCYEGIEGEQKYSSNLPITSPLDRGGHFTFQNDPVPISNCELSDKVHNYRIHKGTNIGNSSSYK